MEYTFQYTCPKKRNKIYNLCSLADPFCAIPLVNISIFLRTAPVDRQLYQCQQYQQFKILIIIQVTYNLHQEFSIVIILSLTVLLRLKHLFYVNSKWTFCLSPYSNSEVCRIRLKSSLSPQWWFYFAHDHLNVILNATIHN